MKLSVHFGINKYDKKYYGNTPNLNGCVNDSLFMQQLAKSHGFTGEMYNDEVCTKTLFIAKLKSAAKLLQSGDTILFSQSSHGTFDNINGKRITGICMHDSIIWDYEIKELLAQFAKGVLIIWITDSCFSEDNFKAFFKFKGTIKSIDSKKVKTTIVHHETVADIKASIISINSSSQFQPSYDLGDYGLFTKELKESTALTRLNYYQQYLKVSELMAKSGYPQTPVFSVVNGDQEKTTYNKFLDYFIK